MRSALASRLTATCALELSLHTSAARKPISSPKMSAIGGSRPGDTAENDAARFPTARRVTIVKIAAVTIAVAVHTTTASKPIERLCSQSITRVTRDAPRRRARRGAGARSAIPRSWCGSFPRCRARCKGASTCAPLVGMTACRLEREGSDAVLRASAGSTDTAVRSARSGGLWRSGSRCADLRGVHVVMADARPCDSAVGAELSRARAAPGRPGRVADAEPAAADRPLHRLLPGRAGGDAAQLPVHGRRDRPCAGGERCSRAARACRAGARP